MNSFIRLSFLPHAHNLAVLLLRVFVGTSLFLRHGLEKITGFSEMVKHFPDPLGIGAQWSLGFALISDALCSLLLIIGLGTRWAAFIIAVNTATAFIFVHRMHLSGEHNGEMAWMYLAASLALFLSGAGKFSGTPSGKRGTGQICTLSVTGQRHQAAWGRTNGYPERF